jgi:molecular chaperone GrpE (heat shock protein)
MNIMKKFISSLLGKKAKSEQELALEGQIQTLQLDLEEREQTIANLKQELERERIGASEQVTETVQAQVERLLFEVATPVAQLLTQAHLLEVEHKPVQTRDVLAVARRIIRTLEDSGLTVVGQVGQTVSFDPDHHEPLEANIGLSSGETVTIRFVGVAYQGKFLRKAGVTRVEA